MAQTWQYLQQILAGRTAHNLGLLDLECLHTEREYFHFEVKRKNKYETEMQNL